MLMGCCLALLDQRGGENGFMISYSILLAKIHLFSNVIYYQILWYMKQYCQIKHSEQLDAVVFVYPVSISMCPKFSSVWHVLIGIGWALIELMWALFPLDINRVNVSILSSWHVIDSCWFVTHGQSLLNINFNIDR